MPASGTEPVRAPIPAPALLALALLAGLPAPARAQAPAPDLAALIECRGSYERFMALLPVLADPLAAIALGWRPQPQANPFMIEYRLNAPVTVFGHHSDHIAIAGDAVLAVLDLTDPRVLARQLQLETGVDTPQKALFGLEVRAEEVPARDGGGPWIESAVVNVSNVDSHPGKTLAGCSYSRDPLEPEEAAPGASASPAVAVPR